jgi:hypothetical protein
MSPIAGSVWKRHGLKHFRFFHGKIKKNEIRHLTAHREGKRAVFALSKAIFHFIFFCILFHSSALVWLDNVTVFRPHPQNAI